MFRSPLGSEKLIFSRKSDSSRASAPVSPLSDRSDGDRDVRLFQDDSFDESFCPEVYTCLKHATGTGESLSALNRRARQSNAGSSSVGMTSSSTRPVGREQPPVPVVASRKGKVQSNSASWRKAAACQILSQSSDDDDDEDFESKVADQEFYEQKNDEPFASCGNDDDQQSLVSQISMGTRTSALQLVSKRQLACDSKIVAPNVAKLSPSSCIEICLFSQDERVMVLCSSDVLKMKSSFFCEVLVKQESEMGSKSGLWRSIVEISEAVPYEAVTLLEGLHESSKVHIDWSYSWARLSVRWQIEELLIEFASQIDDHVESLTMRINASHWRTAPGNLVGMRVAVFRKASSITPTIATGVVVAPLHSTCYSKLRVAFDTMPESFLCQLSAPPTPVQQHPPTLAFLRQRSLSSTCIASTSLGVDVGIGIGIGSPRCSSPKQGQRASKQIVADVAEPIWVKADKEGACWQEPDEVFANSKLVVSVTDRRLFWEMARAIVLFPQLAYYCKGSVKNSSELCAFLVKKENKCLWYPEVSLDFLPKDDAIDLIRRAYALSLFPCPSEKMTQFEN